MSAYASYYWPGIWTAQSEAQLQLAVSGEPQVIFPGKSRIISVAFSNPAQSDFAGEIRARVYQASSATTFLFSDAPWKNVAVPAEKPFWKPLLWIFHG